MPKSKRNKQISLTKTSKGPVRDRKLQLAASVQEALTSHSYAWVIWAAGIPNKNLKELRDRVKPDKIIMGKNAVLSKAVGSGEDDEPANGSSGLNQFLAGGAALFFTNTEPDLVKEMFNNWKSYRTPTAGVVAPMEYVMPAGPTKYAHSLEPRLKELGLPTVLENQIVALTDDYTVCSAGDALTKQAAAILTLEGVECAEVRVQAAAYWSAKDGAVVEV